MRRVVLAFAVSAAACAGGEPPAPASTTAIASSSPTASSAAPPASIVPMAVASSSASIAIAQAALPSKPQLGTTRLISWIYEKPSRDSAHLGYLRAGAHLTRSADPVSADEHPAPCPGKWWKVEPAGYVCEGSEGVTTDLDDPTIVAAAKFPVKVDEPFAYGYGTSYGVPFYARVPTLDEMANVEGDADAREARTKSIAAMYAKGDPAKVPPASALSIMDMPDFLRDHAQAPPVLDWLAGQKSLTAGYAWAGMRLSFLDAFDVDGRTFYLTSEHLIVPADRMRAARLADFHGVELPTKEGDPGEHLPLVWVRWKPAKIYLRNGDDVTETADELPFQAHAEVAKEPIDLHGVRYYALKASPKKLVRASVVTRVDPSTALPENVGADDVWIEVRLAHQVLTVYRGLTPIFQTLVSTGVDGADDPETTRSTPRGQFRIHSKHWSYRMSADEHPPWKDGDKPDPKYRIDDVGYVQYFTGGYALHSAYWHDSFGNPKSHGCINLSPRDAKWLFGQTKPAIPEAWYGVYGGKGVAELGSYLVVHSW